MMFPRFDRPLKLVLDTETTGLEFWKDRVFGISLADEQLNTWYWDIRTEPRVLEWLRDMIKAGIVTDWIGHNFKFDLHMMREAGVDIPLDRVHCTMIRAALLNEHEPVYTLDFLARKYCSVKKDDEIYGEMAKLFGGRDTRNVQMGNISKAPEDVVAKYAKQDALATMSLFQHQEKEIDTIAQVLRLEMDLLPVIISMERFGVRVDVERAEKAVGDISVRAEKMQSHLNSLAGFAVNPNPSGSIVKLFNPQKREDGRWVLNDGTIADTTDGGKASINAECLRRMRHPAAKAILDLRKLLKTRDTFLLGHILGHHHDGVVHPNYNQTKNDDEAGTGTGRLSVTQPALQQIPSRDKEIKSIVRPIFLPDEYADWMGLDWSQFEFRVANHYGKVPSILQAYRDNPNLDFHQLVSDLTGIPRNAQYAGGPSSKAINLGLAFNMGSGRMAQEMGLPYTEAEGSSGNIYLKAGPEAEAIFDKYHAANPGMQQTAKRASSIARERGYVLTMMGRRIRFPGKQFTHKASGLIYQGTSADAMKVKLIQLHKYLEETDQGRLLLSVHDEVGISTEKDANHEEIARIYTTFDGVECPMNFRVPITCDWGVGPDWYAAKG